MSKQKLLGLAIVWCFTLNIYLHRSISISLLNSVTFLVALIYVSYSQIKPKTRSALFIFLLSLIPLFTFSTSQIWVYPFAILAPIFWYLSIKIQKLRTIFITSGFLCCFWGALLANGVLSSPLLVDQDRLIWTNQLSNALINNHQEKAVFILFRLRPILFNKGIIYIYTFLTKVVSVFKLRNLYDTILLANIYPLVIGLITAFKERHRFINIINITGLALILTAAGIGRSPDKFNSLFMAAPILTYLIVSGYEFVNKKYYTALFVISILILIGIPNL